MVTVIQLIKPVHLLFMNGQVQFKDFKKMHKAMKDNVKIMILSVMLQMLITLLQT